MDKKYIDCEAFKRKMIDEKNFFPTAVAAALKEMPAADVVEVVRCRNCKHFKTDTDYCKEHNKGYCEWDNVVKSKRHFCSYGERKDEG